MVGIRIMPIKLSIAFVECPTFPRTLPRLVTCWCCATSRGPGSRRVTRHLPLSCCTWQRMGVWKLPLEWCAPLGSTSTCTRRDQTSLCGQCSPDPLCNAGKIQGMHCMAVIVEYTDTMNHEDNTHDTDNIHVNISYQELSKWYYPLFFFLDIFWCMKQATFNGWDYIAKLIGYTSPFCNLFYNWPCLKWMTWYIIMQHWCPLYYLLTVKTYSASYS